MHVSILKAHPPSPFMDLNTHPLWVITIKINNKYSLFSQFYLYKHLFLFKKLVYIFHYVYTLFIYLLTSPTAGNSPNQSPTGWNQSKTLPPAQKERVSSFNSQEINKIVSPQKHSTLCSPERLLSVSPFLSTMIHLSNLHETHLDLYIKLLKWTDVSFLPASEG